MLRPTLETYILAPNTLFAAYYHYYKINHLSLK